MDLSEDMNRLIICNNLKLLCIIPIQKLLGYHLKGVCSKLLKDHQKRLLIKISYDLYITHLMNYKHLLQKKIKTRIFDQINVISN